MRTLLQRTNKARTGIAALLYAMTDTVTLIVESMMLRPRNWRQRRLVRVPVRARLRR